jgi:LysR family transcriptional regulator, regulator for bpeEF and oprC
MEVFVRVVEVGSFSRAAERLDMGKATVTTVLQNLENHLGVRLLNRTTRRLSLTDDGTAYYERAVRILADVEETEAALSRAAVKPQGRLRVDMPVALARSHVIPALPRFCAQYPEVTVFATLNDQVTDLVEEGIDAVIRIGNLKDSTLVARKVYDTKGIICASPEFIARFGEPSAPEELGNYNCLGFISPSSGRVRDWSLENGGKRYSHMPSGNVHTNSVEALLDAAVGGAGLIFLLDFAVSRAISAGLLQPVLPGWSTTRSVSVAYPQNRHLSAKVRVFVDFVAGLFPKVRRG